MQNLHLKNLQNLNYINIYIDYLIKKIQSTNNTKEIKKFHNKATDFLLKELNKIKIVNSRITRVQSDIIHYISYKKNNLNEITIEKLRELAQTVIELNKLKDITINSYIAKTSYEITDYYYITPIEYTRLLPFGEKETRYLDISIKNNKVIDINVNW